MKQSLPTYTYGDGSGNLYTITPALLIYDPVKPEESSTGMYNGGDPAEVPLSADTYEALRTLLDQAINNPEVHIEDRIKTSGMITRTTKGEVKKVILRPKSAELEAIEQVLRSMRNPE